MTLRAFTYALVLVLMAPLLVLIAVSFTTAGYVAFPPQGFTLHWYWEALHKEEYIRSFVISILVAALTAGAATLVGTLVALAVVRYRFPGREAINAFFMSPLILPTIVIGIALLQFYNRIGIGSTVTSLVMGHVIITTPYVIRLVAASLTGIDRAVERAAQNLGAPPLRVFRRVTLPLIRPGLLAGAVFAFITSFDNVTVSVFLTSPKLVTLPIRIYSQMDQPVYPWLVAFCSMIIFLTALFIGAIERFLSVRNLFAAE